MLAPKNSEKDMFMQPFWDGVDAHREVAGSSLSMFSLFFLLSGIWQRGLQAQRDPNTKIATARM